jgi:hypothetical protein
MARMVLILNSPTLKVATDQAGLATGQAVECQVTSAVVKATPKYSTIPATGCSGETQSPGLTGYSFELAWLQDWQTPTPGGLSYFAFSHDGQAVWIEFTPDSSDPTQVLTGEVFAAAGDYGGTFGDGSAAVATASWPFVSTPTIPAPAAAAVSA